MATMKKSTSKSKHAVPAAVKKSSESHAPAKTAVEKEPVAATPINPAPQSRHVTFKVHADPDSKVFVAGDFNHWNVTANPLTDPTGKGNFSVVIELAPGSYQYKFFINGTWCVDPACTEWIQNNLGTLNSICKV